MNFPILITGSEGFLGSNLARKLGGIHKYDIICTSKRISSENNSYKYESGDLCDSSFSNYLIKKYSPQVIINTVAWTDVDGCEKNPDRANLVNFQTAKNIIDSVFYTNIRVIHISTDQVYSGPGPHQEKILIQ